MPLPYEVLSLILSFLDICDKITCLTICKAWYEPTLDSLCNYVNLQSFQKARRFLYFIAHHPMTPGLYVRKIKIFSAQGPRRRPLNFTEFELLARYCINLNELCFHDPWYWQCLLQLDWSCTWKKLYKLPAVRSSSASYTLYSQLRDRLKEIHIIKRPAFEDLLNLLSSMTRVKSIVLEGSSWNLTSAELEKIHLAGRQARSLKMRFRMPPSADNQLSTIKLSNDIALLDSLSCQIDHPNSGWFSIIKHMYYNIHTLSLHLLDSVSFIGEELFGSISSFKPAVELIKHINVQRLELFLRNYYLMNHVENMIRSVVYEYSLVLPEATSSISFILYYFDKPINGGSGNRLHKPRPFKSITTKSCRGPYGTQKHVHHEFIMTFDIPEALDYNEINAIKSFTTGPVNVSVTKLTMTRELIFGVSIRSPYLIYLDVLLTHFGSLVFLSVGCVVVRHEAHLAEHQTRYMQLSVSSTAMESQTVFTSFKSLIVKSININRSLFVFLFKKCPNISILKIIDCKLDEETKLVLECLCLQHNVLLYIEQ